MVHEIGAVRYNFFLDEMIIQKNRLAHAKLEAEGCIPTYCRDLQFAPAMTV